MTFLFTLLQCGVLSNEMVEMTYFIKHQPSLVAELHDRFHSVSDPQSELWGQHLSHAEVIALQTPSPEHQDVVQRHLAAINATNIRYTQGAEPRVYSIYILNILQALICCRLY